MTLADLILDALRFFLGLSYLALVAALLSDRLRQRRTHFHTNTVTLVGALCSTLYFGYQLITFRHAASGWELIAINAASNLFMWSLVAGWFKGKVKRG